MPSLIEKYPSIGINEFIKHFNGCDYFINQDYNSADKSLDQGYREDLKVCVPKHSSNSAFGRYAKKRKIKPYLVYSKTADCKLNRESNELYSFFGSGISAISLAYKEGAEKVLLIGYTTDQEYKYFYSDAIRPRSKENIENCKKAIREIKDTGKIKMYKYREETDFDLETLTLEELYKNGI